MCRLCPPIAKSHAHYRPAVPTGTARRSAECPDGGIGRRAGLKHQWSNPCRFDPGSGYQTKCKCLTFKHLHLSFSFLHHGCTTEWAVLGQNQYFSKNFENDLRLLSKLQSHVTLQNQLIQIQHYVVLLYSCDQRSNFVQMNKFSKQTQIFHPK